MGWLSGFSSYREIKQYLLREDRDGYKILKHAATQCGRNLWVIFKHPKGFDFIALFLIRRHQGVYGYKDLTECMGPAEHDCPLEFLELVPLPTDSKYAAGWREHVRNHHVKRTQRFNIGETVSIYGKSYKVVDKVKKSYRVQDLNTGIVYKCSASKMSHVPF